MKTAADIDPGLLKFLTTPLKLPVNLGAWEQLAVIGKKEVLTLMSLAASERVLPDQVLLAQIIHIRPDHVDFGSPALVRREQHRRLLAADVAQAVGVKDSGKSFFRQASQDNTPGGVVALISKTQSKHDFASSDSQFIQIVLKNPFAIDGTNLKYSAGEGDWLRIDSFESILAENSTTLADELQKLASAPEPSFASPRITNRKKTKSMEILCEKDYLRHFSPLVACGDVLLCAPTVHLPENERDQIASIGGGGCMFVLTGTPDVALIRRLSLFTHKIIATIWAYQDLVRMAAEKSRAAGAEDAFQMIVHSFGNAVNYVPPEAPQATRVLLVENHIIRAARLLFTRSMPGLRDWLKREDDWIGLLAAASCKQEEKLDFVAGPLLEQDRIDSRLFALLLELSRNCVKHSSENPKRGTLEVQAGSTSHSLRLLTENACDYCCPRDLWDKFSKEGKSISREKGLDFILWLAQSLAGDRGSVVFEVTDPTNDSDPVFEKISTSFEQMPVECRVARRVLEELPNLKRTEDPRKFRVRCIVEINNTQPG